MRRTARNSILGTALAAALVLSGCAGETDTPGEEVSDSGLGDLLNLGTGNEPISYDPAQAQEGDNFPFFQAVYDTLIHRQPDGSLAPMLATDWEYDETNTELTLNLRDDVVFSDGVPFNADVAKINLERFQESSGPQGHTLGAVDSVEVLDDTTLQLSLAEPDPALLIYLSNAAGLMGSPDALETAEIATVPVGSGPYTLDTANTQQGARYTFVMNEDYWNPELQHYRQIVMHVIPDSTARYSALASGQIDVAHLDPRSAQQADADGLVDNAEPLNWYGMTIADRDGEIVPALADPRVRQAINYAVNKEPILENILLGRGILTSQTFGDATTAFDPDLDDTYSYDPERAVELMAEAGYEDGFEIDFPQSTTGYDPALWAVLEDNLGELNITINWVPVILTDYVSELTSGRYPMFLIPLFQADTWVAINQQIAPDALFNPFDVQRDEIDELIEEIRHAEDADAQAGPAQELNRYLVDEAWFVPFARREQLIFSNDSVIVEFQVEQAFPSIYNFSPANTE